MRPSYKRAVAIVYVLGVFMQILDATVVNVALPAIGADFDVPANEVEWVVLGYLLTLIVGIPAAAWTADRFGPKRTYILALVGFVATSVLCGLATSLRFLVVARLLQGLPAGLIMPVGAAILYRAFPLNERAQAASAVVGVAVVAPSIGPVLGGVLVDNLSWHWIFLVNVPIGVLAVTLAWLWLEDDEQSQAPRFDAVGFILAGLGLGGVLYALSAAPKGGWLSPLVAVAMVGGAIMLAVLIRYELRRSEPLVDLRLFADRHFRTMNLVALSLYGGFITLIYVLPLYLQAYRGFSATASGTTQAPQAIGIFVVSNLFARRAYRRFGARANLLFGSIAAGTISALFAFVGDDTGLWIMRLGTFGRGLAIGTMFVTIQTAAYATMSMAQTGKAVSIFTTQRQLASALGTATVATILTSALRLDLGLDAYRIAFLAGGAMFIPAALLAMRVNDDDVAATRA